MKLIFLLLISLTLKAQVWEKMPKVEGDTVFSYKIKNYVQLPGDSTEYQTIGIYVQILPKVGNVVETWTKRIYLGDYLKPTGRKFKIVDEVVKREITMTDKMLNSDNNFDR